MPGLSVFRRLARDHRSQGLGLLMLALSPLAGAQLCGAAPKIGAAASGVEPTERFRMITSQCAAITTPMKVHRAAQLDLYDRPAVAITLPADAPASAPAPAAPTSTESRREAKPLPRGGERVLSLAPALTDAARTGLGLGIGVVPRLHVRDRVQQQRVDLVLARSVRK